VSERKENDGVAAEPATPRMADEVTVKLDDPDPFGQNSIGPLPLITPGLPALNLIIGPVLADVFSSKN